MPRRSVLLGLLGLALVPAPSHAGVVATPIGNFTAPTYIAAPPGDTHRVFIVEQPGVIKEIKDGGAPTTFMDISSKVEYTGGEQGLLSMAFAPDYATSGRFYLYYTTTNCPDSPGCDEKVSEFTATNPDTGDPTSEKPLITIPHPSQENHNGGQLQFGPDGMLYISTGDGGGSNDTEQNAQKLTNLKGKILRIDPGATTYTIPAGNPFSGTECSAGDNGGGNCPEIWAYGLRNPWRFSFDSTSGDLIIGDVGQSRDEEVDLAAPGQNVGANYGWPCYEGTELNASRPLAECSPLPAPVAGPSLVYHHPSNCAGASFCGAGVIGGYVMHDPSLPSLNGCYVYGDLGNSRLRLVHLGQASSFSDQDLGPHVSNLSSFGVDASGHLWAADIGGPVYRLDSDGNAATMPGCPPPVSPPGTPGGDHTPAKLKITRARNQHVLRTHYVKITVVSNEVAVITARGTVSIPKSSRVYRLHTTSRGTLGKKKVVLHLRISKKTLSRIRHALRHRKSLTARITVTSKDASGNFSKAKHTTVRLVR
jgi:glucose/arabinose dehydrogenase